MDKYIEHEAVMQEFADFVKRSNNSDFVPPPTWNQAVQIVEDFPAADVVEVVRCKDCKNYIDSRCYSLHRGLNDWRSKEDYCSNGKRRIER